MAAHRAIDEVVIEAAKRRVVRDRACYKPSSASLARCVDWCVSTCPMRRSWWVGISPTCLGWENGLIECNNFIRLPYPSSEKERELLKIVRKHLSTDNIAAILIEPIQGSWEGETVPSEFLVQLKNLCIQFETCLIMDETLTGLYRTG